MKIAPSILNSNFIDLKKVLKSISSADLLHLDIMDGNFVPNISFGPYISKLIALNTKLPIDAHLMVKKPLEYIDKFVFPNSYCITIHYEADNIDECIKKIKEHKIKVGLSIKPETKVNKIIKYLKDIDLVLVMSVNPGFGGQEFIKDTTTKIYQLVELRNQYKLNYEIEVDGGINDTTISYINKADIAVVGSYLFKQKNINKSIKLLKNK